MSSEDVTVQNRRSAQFSLPKVAGPILGLIALCIIFAVVSPNFLRVTNLLNILVQVAVISVVAAGVAVVILTGRIDLSVGSLLGLAGVLAGGTLATTDSVVLAIVVALTVGALAGLVNGLLVSFGNVPSFVATLGMLSIARGLAFVYTQGRPISGFPEGFRVFGSSYLFDTIPVPVIVSVLLFLLLAFVLTQTPFGRSIYAVGSNEKAALLSGLNTAYYKTSAFVLSGLLAGLAGIMFIGRINSAHPTAGETYELDAIAAVVIGGISLSGGRGSIIGVFFGALIIGVLRNGLNLLNVDPFWQGVVIGSAIILAVLVDSLTRRREGDEPAK